MSYSPRMSLIAQSTNPRMDFKRCLDQLADKGLIASRNNLAWAI